MALRDPGGPRGFVRYQVDVYPETADAFKAICQAKGVTIKHQFNKIIEEFIAKEQGSGKGKK